MERPTILLAVNGDADGHVDALRRAGFEPILASEARASTPPADLGVIDCDLPHDMVSGVYRHLHDGRDTPTLLIVGDGTQLPR